MRAEDTSLASNVTHTQFDASVKRLNDTVEEMLSRVMGQKQVQRRDGLQDPELVVTSFERRRGKANSSERLFSCGFVFSQLTPGVTRNHGKGRSMERTGAGVPAHLAGDKQVKIPEFTWNGKGFAEP
ncbi:hypothetical protein llap_8489 [Limosa lapponica baueri]|uniref:Uncharacterized protein n=1 Tax=Limosa lapponica baueri TaxID=1758121 RepID=A0A2I0U557_LIMLA|nr:hypothetical protein llap_8489 [Limosa lapponica baueri]